MHFLGGAGWLYRPFQGFSRDGRLTLFGSGNVEVDRCRRNVSVSHPFLDDRQRHCRSDGNDPESTTQARGVAAAASTPAARITARTRRQAVVRDQGDTRRGVDPICSEGEGPGYPTAGVDRKFGDRPDRRRSGLGGLEEAVPLVLGEIFSLSEQIVELLHALSFITSAV